MLHEPKSERGRPPSGPDDPNWGLAPEGLDEVHRSFYAAHPHDYFSRRVQNLVLAAGKPAEVASLLAGGVSYGGLTMPASPVFKSEEEERRQDAFVVAETEVLYHHTIETLLRLYLAHAHLPISPPLELAGMRSFSKFKNALSNRFVGSALEEHREELARVFHGVSRPQQVTPEPPAGLWDTSLDRIEGWLRHFAGHFLAAANLYNAAKHGFAVQAGAGGLTFPADQSPVIDHQGPVITYLEVVRQSDQRRRWSQTMAFVDVERTLVFIHQAILLIEALWRIGEARYVTGPPETLRFLNTTPSVEAVLTAGSGEEAEIRPTTLGIQLLYYSDEYMENHGAAN